MIARASILAVLFAIELAACDPVSPPPPGQSDASASPNASILPAPLATESPEPFDGGAASPIDDGGILGIQADPAGRLIIPDAGSPPPESMRPSTPLPAENVPFARDANGLSLDAAFRWRDLPAPPRAPEVSADAVREAQKQTALTLKIDLSDAGRLRVELLGAAFPLPAHSELRARSDHYGNLLMWPNGGGYRVIPSGALRPLFGERRVDVTPLSPGVVRAQGHAKRLGLDARKVELASNVASVKLELGKINDAGEGGALLCRALVELAGVDPKTPVCQSGEVPLFAAYTWHEGGGITFEVTSYAKRTDLAASALLAPPPGVPHLATGLPSVPHGIFLSREALAALRSAPINLLPVRDPAVPGEGFVAQNQSDRLMYLVLDGVPVVQVPPHAEQYVIGPPRGRYVAQWRTFLGEKVAPPQTTEMPARLIYGSAPDAGAPDGG